MVKKVVNILILFVAGSYLLSGQTNYIGLHSDQVKILMHQEQKKMNLDNSTVNNTFNYLKYVDYLNEQTLLYALDENDTCTWWKLMCDYSLLEEKKQWLNNNYRRLSSNEWFYTLEGDKVVLSLIEEEWFFTIKAKPEEK
ncbi:MAG: hypothetical protein ACOCXS_00325 [Bacteroidota bacterium]